MTYFDDMREHRMQNEMERRYLMYIKYFERTGDMQALDNATFWFIAATCGKAYAIQHFLP